MCARRIVEVTTLDRDLELEREELLAQIAASVPEGLMDLCGEIDSSGTPAISIEINTEGAAYANQRSDTGRRHKEEEHRAR